MEVNLDDDDFEFITGKMSGERYFARARIRELELRTTGQFVPLFATAASVVFQVLISFWSYFSLVYLGALALNTAATAWLYYRHFKAKRDLKIARVIERMER